MGIGLSGFANIVKADRGIVKNAKGLSWAHFFVWITMGIALCVSIWFTIGV